MTNACGSATAYNAAKPSPTNNQFSQRTAGAVGWRHGSRPTCAMFMTAIASNPIPVKWAAARLGLISDGIRLPLVPLSRPFHGPVLEALQAAGIGFAGGRAGL